ncbi:MAG: MBL fold metallo-hydrolase [Aestuariibacter sp.]
MNSIVRMLTLIACLSISLHAFPHGQATYLGNSAVVVESDNVKVMFDPFFHNGFGIYQLVPNELRDNVMKGISPFNDIDAIFISHAHEDHFSAEDVVSYLNHHQQTHLFAPKQAIQQLAELTVDSSISSRIHSIDLQIGDTPVNLTHKDLQVDAIRIPHAGWPRRKEVENLIFRVTLEKDITTMHMGDADADDDHYLPYTSYWQAKTTNINFPPYWFFMSAEGNDILQELLNVEQHIGVHVPMKAPKQLQNTGKQYFHQPGSHVEIE